MADIDEGCYETQTEKSQAKELTKGRTRKVIDQHIFGWASDNGLSVDRKATGGGGHLSVDLASGFGTSGRGGFVGAVSVETLLSTLLAFQEDAGALSYAFNRGSTGKKTDKDVGEADVTNAPWLTDQELRGDTTSPLSEYRKVINGLVARVNKGDLIGLQAVTAKLVAFNQRLTNPNVTEETRKAQTEAPENISHYQAVNIEHVFSEEEEEGRPQDRGPRHPGPGRRGHARAGHRGTVKRGPAGKRQCEGIASRAHYQAQKAPLNWPVRKYPSFSSIAPDGTADLLLARGCRPPGYRRASAPSVVGWGRPELSRHASNMSMIPTTSAHRLKLRPDRLSHSAEKALSDVQAFRTPIGGFVALSAPRATADACGPFGRCAGRPPAVTRSVTLARAGSGWRSATK